MTKLQFLLLGALIAGSGKDLLASGNFTTDFMNAASNGDRVMIETLISDARATTPLRNRASGTAGRLRHTELAEFIRTWTPADANVVVQSVVEPLVTTVEIPVALPTEFLQGPEFIQASQLLQALAALALTNVQQQTPNLQEDEVRVADNVMTDMLVNDEFSQVEREIQQAQFNLNRSFSNAAFLGDVDVLRGLLTQNPDVAVLEDVYFSSVMNGNSAISDLLENYVDAARAFENAEKRNAKFLEAVHSENTTQLERVLETEFKGSIPSADVISTALSNAQYAVNPAINTFLINLNEARTAEILGNTVTASIEVVAPVNIPVTIPAETETLDPEIQAYINGAFARAIYDRNFDDVRNILLGGVGLPASGLVRNELTELRRIPNDPRVDLLIEILEAHQNSRP